jgi:hypothetical protein
LIFLLNGIDVIVLSEHSSHLLQMFDMVVAAPLKSAFTLKLDRTISWFTDANPGERDKTQILCRILIRSFTNALHRGATSANIISGLRVTGIMPSNPEIPLESQFAIDPIDPASFTIHRTGAEINETVFMFSSGLDFLSRHELMRPMGMQIMILMIDRFGKLFTVTR